MAQDGIGWPQDGPRWHRLARKRAQDGLKMAPIRSQSLHICVFICIFGTYVHIYMHICAYRCIYAHTGAHLVRIYGIYVHIWQIPVYMCIYVHISACICTYQPKPYAMCCSSLTCPFWALSALGLTLACYT